MIPIQLTIEGLYSYQTRQTIDFNPLINAGLFGIFGNVGSGKSSILEAITFVLYGETERLNAKDKRAYNMMNLKSDRAYIAFDFKNYEGKIYRATREFKRSNKRFDDIKAPTVVFYEEINGQWLPLNHVNAQKIIGLSYDNFKRTIIIPQGKFKEFIELGAKDRTQMMKELFNLHKYDLFDKVAALNSQNLTQLNQLQGKLSGYEEVSEEGMTHLTEKLADENKRVTEITLKNNEVQQKLQQLQMVKNDFELLQNKKMAFIDLNQQKPEIDAISEELLMYERVYKVFHQLVIDLKNTETELKQTKDKTETNEATLHHLQTHFSKTSSDLADLQPHYTDLPNKRLEENDLILITESIQLANDIVELQERTKNGKEKVVELHALIKHTSQHIQHIENEIQQLSENKIDNLVLLNASNWYVQQNNFLADLEKQQVKIAQLSSDIAKTNTIFNEKFNSTEQFEAQIKTKSETFAENIKTIEEKRRALQVQQQLARFAHNLNPGEACPLCGATEHPAILEPADVSDSLAVLQNEENQLHIKNNEWLQITDTLKQHLQKISMLNEQLNQEKISLTSLKNKIENHKNQFEWSVFNSDNYEEFEHKKKATLLIEKQINEKNALVQKQRLVLETQREHLEKYTNALDQFRLAETQKQAQVDQNKTNLKKLVFANFEKSSVDELKQELKVLTANNDTLERNFKLLTETFHKQNNQLTAQLTLVETTKAQQLVLQNKLSALKEIFNQKRVAYQIATKEEVTTILKKELDTEALHQKINAFTIAYQTLQNQINDLEAKLQHTSFNTYEYEQLLVQYNEVKNQVAAAIENATATKTELSRLKKAFQEKLLLTKQMNVLQKRHENLKILMNMFKGSGFVQYVSTIYLRQLCENANVRFRKMTRNQLSLHLNDANDFEVIDYLNEGKSRSVKTLSGGQMFQVSLSLALALAESVQTNAKADKNFFFIDEGFGTQDAESVNIVFETLNQLHKENRIVGIISHVEELKDRIPVALNITKDEEKGSFIEFI